MTTRYSTSRPDAEVGRETRTQVRMPQQMSSSLFQGWGPKF
jgi:hypothetical protein